MSTTAEVIPDSTIRVLDHGFVRLDGALADDLSVVNGARVSFARRKEEMDESDEGLIRFLMRERHGCYDDATDVLTDDGWKSWPEVTGEELFATRSRTGRLEYQPALRLVRKEYRGHMIGFQGASVDLLVTPDHRILASPQTTMPERLSPRFRLLPAHAVLWRQHRHTTTAQWVAPATSSFAFDGTSFPAYPLLRLVGLFIGDGNLAASNQLAFNVRKSREVAFLRGSVADAGLELRTWKNDVLAVPVGPELRTLFASCYRDREKVIPPWLLTLDGACLEALYAGLLNSDGSVLPRERGEDREVYSTTSRRLADGVQELALKIGRSASVRPHPASLGDGHYGEKPRWRVSIYSGRNSRPGLCRTREQAESHMGVERYDGAIHCVEVPNSTLYVRRNGYPVWCGNTPFEHNAFRFHVRCPIFVAREWFRHRVGSFNEFSMRYARASDEFYVPEPEDVRTQVGKPGAYTFEQVSDEVAEETREKLQAVYEAAYRAYEELVELGVAREVARAALPVGAYTEFYWTVNARSLMNFISLRNSETAQREIRRYAEACERFLEEQMPVTYAAFVANDRTAP
ncbi:MAG: FAD-dependent thymidylate synthase [Gaiellaceae bacterium]